MKNTFKRAITMLLAISIFTLASVPSLATAAASTATTFKDVKSTSWYNTYVNKLIELKITVGYKDGTYKPANSVTRAEFATFLCKTKGFAQTAGDPFADTQNHWASGYITIALANGIIDLPTDKKFRPNDAITRLEAVEMMCRALNIEEDTTTKNPYSDVKTNTGYTNAAYANYLMQGSIVKNARYFKPSDKLTRGEVASVIVNAYEYNADKMTFLNKKIAVANEKAVAEKAEQDRLSAWKESVKGIPSELMSNTHGLVKPSVYESYKYLRDVETDYFKNWGAKYGMAPEQFEKEMVRVGSLYANTIANVNYTKIDVYEKNMKNVQEKSDIKYRLQNTINKIISRKVISEGEFITSTGMLVFAEWSNPVLRGTLKYKYSAPTTKEALNSEIVASTGKPSQLNTWYEQDFELIFIPSSDGLRISAMESISDIRISK